MAEVNVRVAEFLRDVKDAYQPSDPTSFWACEPIFRKLASSGFLTDIVNEALNDLRKEPAFPGNWLANELVLHRGGGFALSVSISDGLQRYIHSLPYYGMHAAIGPLGFRCDVYQLPDTYRNDIFDSNIKLQFVETIVTQPNDVLLLRSGKFVYDIRPHHPTPILKFMTAVLQPMEWLFTRSGLQAWQANDSDLTFTQLRVAADVLGRFAHHSSLAPLKHLARHPHHAVRWTAIQNIGRISRTEALVALRQAANDSHPHVQRAAQKTLEKLK
jgi:hypothetical protein